MSRLPGSMTMQHSRTTKTSRGNDTRSFTLPPLRTTKLMRGSHSRSSISSGEESDHMPSRLSFSSAGSAHTAMTSPRSSLASPRSQSGQRSLHQALGDGPSSLNLRVGERVAVDSMGIIGTLRFLGPTQFKAGIWAGIQLDILGSGKNDGTVNNLRYFDCPPQTGIFVNASKVLPLDRDTDSGESYSPPMPAALNNRSSVARVTSAPRGQQRHSNNPPATQQRRLGRSLSVSQSTHPTYGRNRRSMPAGPTAASAGTAKPRPVSVTQTRRLGVPTMRIHPSGRSAHMETSYSDEQPSRDDGNNDDDTMLTNTPIPLNLTASRSAEPAINSEPEDPHARLTRMIGEAIHQAPGEAVMRIQQLQLRVEVLEAENRYLKLENAQNKTAEQILERSLDLKKKSGDNVEDYHFTLEGHKAIVEEIKKDHEASRTAWNEKTEDLESTTKQLEERVVSLEAEETRLKKERDELKKESNELKKDSEELKKENDKLQSSAEESRTAITATEQRTKELEEKLASMQAELDKAVEQAAQATQAAKAAAEATTMSNYYSEDPEELRRLVGKLEAQLEETHEKMSSLTGTMRAKDNFLGTLTEQLDSCRNQVEEKEREIRRVRSDAERHAREKEHLREEVNGLEKKLTDHGECVSSDAYEQRRSELAQAKEDLDKTTAQAQDCRLRIETLENSIDELKRAGMESIELYESSVKRHRADMESINAELVEERHKIGALEAEREDLRKAGLDAIEAYEATIEELKKDRAKTAQEQTDKCSELQSMVDKLKRELDQLTTVKNPASGDRVVITEVNA